MQMLFFFLQMNSSGPPQQLTRLWKKENTGGVNRTVVPPPRTKRVASPRAPSDTPVCGAGGMEATISQSSSATVPSRWPAVIWWNDFTATLSGATFPVTTCACRQPLDKDHITDG